MKINLNLFSENEQKYFESVFDDGALPSLQAKRLMMDAVWDELKCDAEMMDDRIAKFYNHPVWLLNGLFIEQDEVSLSNRRIFAEYVASVKPSRVADFGGGFGTLARMVGNFCPNTKVHIIEPHPHPIAVALAEKTSNVRYMPGFYGSYDVLIATDVFEHVSDPLGLVEQTAKHLRVGGKYLIANCFWPVIKCHLPSTFHFRISWDSAMCAMNLQPSETVLYGRAYEKMDAVVAAAARSIEQRSKRFFPLIEHLPGRLRPCVVKLLFVSGR